MSVLLVIGSLIGICIITVIMLWVFGVFSKKTQIPTPTPGPGLTPAPTPAPSACKQHGDDCDDNQCCSNLKCRVPIPMYGVPISTTKKCSKKWDCKSDKYCYNAQRTLPCTYCTSDGPSPFDCPPTCNLFSPDGSNKYCIDPTNGPKYLDTSECDTMQTLCGYRCPGSKHGVCCLEQGICKAGKCTGESKSVNISGKCADDNECYVCKQATKSDCLSKHKILENLHFLYEKDPSIISFLMRKGINTIVVHGLATSNHTHKYIHEAIYKTFKHIQKTYNGKLDVLWIDDKNNDLYNNDGNRFLIFSSPHYGTDKFLPVLDNAYYILHYRDINYMTKKIITKYDDLLRRKKAVKYIEFREKNNNMSKIDNHSPFWYSEIDNSLNIPWATNLMPNEIDLKINLIKSLKKLPYKSKNSYFCGSIWRVNKKEMSIWEKICAKYNINPEFTREKNEKIHQEKVRTAYIAPAIQGSSDRINEDKFYIPCRIFKNISYGNIAVTNNLGVYNLFKNFLIIYDDDLEKLMVKYIQYINSLEDPANFRKHKEDMIKIMTHVKNHHTYLSRIKLLVSKLS